MRAGAPPPTLRRMTSPARATTRPLVVAVLSLVLGAQLAGSAGATPRSAVPRRLVPGRLTLASAEHRVPGMIERTAGAGLSLPVSSNIYVALFHARSHDANFPDWFMGVARSAGRTFVFAETERWVETGILQYDWAKEVPKSDLVLADRDHTLEIHTGTDLGRFGAIDMVFSASHEGHHTYSCYQTGRALFVQRRVQGSLTGTMSFAPGESGLPAVIRATHPHAHVDRSVATGATCPSSAHGCPLGREFLMTTSDGASLVAIPRFGFLLSRTRAVVDGVTLSKLAGNFAGPGTGVGGVHLTRDDLTIDGDVSGDPFSGTVAFDRSGPPLIHEGARCRRVVTPFVWREGSLSVGFDTGAVAFTGADVDARLLWGGRA